jgi:hypothetical protein
MSAENPAAEIARIEAACRAEKSEAKRLSLVAQLPALRVEALRQKIAEEKALAQKAQAKIRELERALDAARKEAQRDNTNHLDAQLAKLQKDESRLVGCARFLSLEDFEAALDSGLVPFQIAPARAILEAWRYGAPSALHGGACMVTSEGSIFYRKATGEILGSHMGEPRLGSSGGSVMPIMVNPETIHDSFEAAEKARAKLSA